MSIEPEAIEVGQCYLTDHNTIMRVLRVMRDQRVQYEWRGGLRMKWRSGILPAREFVASADRRVPFDWTTGEEG
jgi:hypothetical protein